MGGAARIARRFETERRGGGRREADAGVALRRQLGVKRTGLVALREIVPVVLEAHGLGLDEASQHGAADFARVALAVGIERPAPFPGVDPHRERARWRDRGCDWRVRTSMPAPLNRASASAMACLAWGEATAQPAVSTKARRRGFRGAGALAGPNSPG